MRLEARQRLRQIGWLLTALGGAALLIVFFTLWRAVPPPDFLVGGIQVNEPDHEVWTQSLSSAGLNTVAVTVYAKQGDWDSFNLWWEEEEPSVVAEIRAAKQTGLEVVLILRVALDHAFERNKFFWHGMIHPLSDEDLTEWFVRYRQFVAEWARIAEIEGVDVLGVSSELNALTSTVVADELPRLIEYWSNPEKVERENLRVLHYADRIKPRHLYVRGWEDYGSPRGYLDERSARHSEWAHRVGWADALDPVSAINLRRSRLDQEWRAVIKTAREHFSGALTYAANFDQYQDVGFWDALDLIGVNAYFPLRSLWREELVGSQLDRLLEVRWRALLRNIDQLRSDRGLGRMPVVFTELGYVSRSNNTYEPWAAQGFSILPTGSGDELFVAWEDQPDSKAERQQALRALYRAHILEGESLLAGILYWKLTTLPGHASIEPFAVVLASDRPTEELTDLDPAVEALARFRVRFDPLRVRMRWARGWPWAS